MLLLGTLRYRVSASLKKIPEGGREEGVPLNGHRLRGCDSTLMPAAENDLCLGLGRTDFEDRLSYVLRGVLDILHGLADACARCLVATFCLCDIFRTGFHKLLEFFVLFHESAVT